MNFFRPVSLPEALAVKSQYPEARPIAGGTDLMVMINFDRCRPAALLDLSRIPELRTVSACADGLLRLGAGVPFNRLQRDHAQVLPSLAMAAGTVGSPQIRQRATIGGNIATASPAGDSLPPLVAAGALIELASARGTRQLALEDFLLGPKRSALQPDELIVAVLVRPRCGPQSFSKVGSRNAMVISISSLALELRPQAQEIRCAIGSAAPKVIRASAAEALGGDFPWPAPGEPARALRPQLVDEFCDRVSQACSPIDDVRGSARYRRHSLAVLARRNLDWAWKELERGSSCV